MKKKIKDVKIGDKIVGTDNKPYDVIDVTDIHIPNNTYEIEFTNGKVRCSDTHEWNIWFSEDRFYTINTETIFLTQDFLKKLNVIIGKYEDGIGINSVKEIDNTEVRCITTNSPDHQFLIYTDSGDRIFTHNCGLSDLWATINRVNCGELLRA